MEWASKKFKEGPLTKNGPIDLAQSWEIHMKKIQLDLWWREKGG